MKANSKFDYIIVGGGLSGLHLSYCFYCDKYFKNYSILIVDKEKPKNLIIIFHIGKQVLGIGMQY